MTAAVLGWTSVQPGVWRCMNAPYLIVRVALPEPGSDPAGLYLVRELDPKTAAVFRGSLGTPAGETSTLDDAKRVAAEHASTIDPKGHS